MPHDVRPLLSPGYSRSQPKRVTLHELSILSPANALENYACVAEILNINSSFDWFYASCPNCHRKVSDADENPHCANDQCPEGSVKPVAWYSFRAQVGDNTGDAEFVFIGNQAEIAVGKPASEIAAQDNPTPYDVPPQLAQIVGKRFLFVVSLRQIGSSTGHRQYTVSRVDPVPPEEPPLSVASSGADHAHDPLAHQEDSLQITHPIPLNVSAQDDVHCPEALVHPSTPATIVDACVRHELAKCDFPASLNDADISTDIKLKRAVSDEPDIHSEERENVKRRLQFSSSSDEQHGSSDDAAAS